MATTRKLPDLVNDSKLLVELHETHAHYFSICNDNSAGQVRRRTWKKETWTRTKRLGGGATGEVWLEKCHTGDKAGQLQAVKVISKGSHFDIYQELETIAKFSQSTSKYEGLFVKSLGWYESDISVFLVMEYFEHGSLASHLTHPLSENKAKQITVQILEGLACFHENEFVHRDLKPDNILVAAKDPEWWVKIGDFGFSKRTGDSSLHSFVGTQKYFAPEVLGLLPWVDTNTEARERYHCTYAMDMWSLGVTAFYMLCHDYPFHGKELLEYLKGSSFPVTRLSQHHISQEGCAFIEALLTVDPEKRLSAAAALENTWLKEYHVEEPSRASAKLPSAIWNRPAALPSGTDASLSWPMDSTWAPQPAYKDPALISTGARSEPERLHTKGSREKALDELKALHERGLQLIADKEHTRAEDLFKQAADGRKTILGPYHKESLKSMQQLGVAYLLQRRSQDAQRTLQFTVDLQTELIGSTHIDTLTSNYWLSSSLLAQGKLDAAHEIIEKVIEMQKVILGIQSEHTIKSLHLCGQIYYEQEKYGNALVLFEQAADAALGINQAVAHETLRSLASCLYKQQRYKESQSILEQIMQAPLLVPDIQLLDLLFDIGQSFYEAQNYTDAQLCFEKVSGYRKELLGPEHEQTINSTLRVTSSLCKQQDKVTQAPGILQRILGMPLPQSTRQSVLDQLHDIGITLWQQRAYTEACTTFQKVLEGRKALLGRRHQDTLSSASWLGRSLLYLGRYPEATELLKSVSRDQHKALGSGHLDTAYTNLWLGQSLHYQGQNKTAHSYIQTTYLILLHTLGKEHKESITCLRRLGSSYCQVEDYSSAEGTLQRALPKAQEVFGPRQEETIRTQVSLGVALYGRRSYQEALEYFCQAADVQMPTLGITNEDTIETLYCIGVSLDIQKRYQESERFWRMAADGRRKLLGASHLKTQDAMRSLAFSLAYQGKLKEAVTLQEEVLKLRQETLGPSDAATIESSKDVERCKKGPKGLGSKWAIFGSERSRQLEYRHL